MLSEDFIDNVSQEISHLHDKSYHPSLENTNVVLDTKHFHRVLIDCTHIT